MHTLQQAVIIQAATLIIILESIQISFAETGQVLLYLMVTNQQKNLGGWLMIFKPISVLGAGT